LLNKFVQTKAADKQSLGYMHTLVIFKYSILLIMRTVGLLSTEKKFQLQINS